MAKARRARRRISSRRIRARPYKFTSSKRVVARNVFATNCPKVLEKKDWEDAICSVCMECPHNAVLLLCSSHDKGCRPYMCGTSFRYSNCLDQYKKASAKLMESHQQLANKAELTNLTCPLCRGEVKGWTILQPARDYLNQKRRSCMQENCSFAGTFNELRKHMKVDHPSARPREVDPDVEQKWRRLEIEQDRDDVISIIRSTMPGSMVFGDYVIDRNAYASDSEEVEDHHDDIQMDNEGGVNAGLGRNLVNVFLMLQAFGAPGNNTRRSDSTALASDTSRDVASDASDLAINHITSEDSDVESSGEEDDSHGNNENGGSMSLRNRLSRQGRILLGRSGRRRRNREFNQNIGHRR